MLDQLKSDFVSDVDRQEALPASFDGDKSKPLGVSELVDTVRHELERS
jgi:hypothetical protein